MNLYPRGDVFLTELPGTIQIKPGSDSALTAEDMNQYIRRGEAVRIAGQWFRVSSEVRGGRGGPGVHLGWVGSRGDNASITVTLRE